MILLYFQLWSPVKDFVTDIEYHAMELGELGALYAPKVFLFSIKAWLSIGSGGHIPLLTCLSQGTIENY